jgi:hypothetical protein
MLTIYTLKDTAYIEGPRIILKNTAYLQERCVFHGTKFTLEDNA